MTNVKSRSTSDVPCQLDCSLNIHKATVVVLAILGASILFLGLYLMFGPIGTISSSFGGFTLALGGMTSIIASVFFEVAR